MAVYKILLLLFGFLDTPFTLVCIDTYVQYIQFCMDHLKVFTTPPPKIKCLLWTAPNLVGKVWLINFSNNSKVRESKNLLEFLKVYICKRYITTFTLCKFHWSVEMHFFLCLSVTINHSIKKVPIIKVSFFLFLNIRVTLLCSLHSKWCKIFKFKFLDVNWILLLS